jgi:predicted dehydrogenase
LGKIRLGLIGAGQIAKAHVAAYLALPALYSGAETVELELVGEVTEGLAKAAAERYGFKRWTTDWRKVTRDSRVDLVDIVTPTYLHKSPAIDAAEHGKNVICEKPLSANSFDAEKMYLAAEKAGVAHMVGFNFRRVPAIAFAKELIKSNALGRIFHLRCQFFEDWGANESAPMVWRYRKSTAGSGALADLGSHTIDLIRHIFAEPESVCAIAQTFIRDRPGKRGQPRKERVDVDDVTISLLKFKNGAIGIVEASWVASGRKIGPDFEIHGSRGSVSFCMERPNELEVYKNDDPDELRGYRRILTGPAHPYSEGLIFGAPSVGMGYEESMVNQMYDLTNAIKKSKSVSPSFYDGWKAQQIIDAILESQHNRIWVNLPR